jgi:hypothetical protein
VAHTCNPSYSGGRDQEDCGSKPAQANSSQDPIFKKPFTKRAGGVAQGVGLKFVPQYHKKKKKKEFFFLHQDAESRKLNQIWKLSKQRPV